MQGLVVGDVAARVTKCNAEQIRDLGQHRTAEQNVVDTVQRLCRIGGGSSEYLFPRSASRRA